MKIYDAVGFIGTNLQTNIQFCTLSQTQYDMCCPQPSSAFICKYNETKFEKNGKKQ